MLDKPPMTLLRGAHVFDPTDIGIMDVLLGGEKILAVGPRLDIRGMPTVLECDSSGLVLIPGLIDGHQHTIGGGGGDGYGSRLPEVGLAELASAGLTTVIGMPGVDTVTKTLVPMLAKAYALEQQGITAFVMEGGFRKPAESLTGSVVRDIYVIEKVIGVKIALGDTNASNFSVDELIQLSRDLHWVGSATGKAASLHIHLGRLSEPAAQLLETVRTSSVPGYRFQATHCNFSAEAVTSAVALTKLGVFVDMTGFFGPEYGDGLAPAASIAMLLEAGAPAELITVSSDANGTVPGQRADGRYSAYTKNLDSVWGAVRSLVNDNGMRLDEALPFVTTNPARALRLSSTKGQVRDGYDADIVLVDHDMVIREVYARGRHILGDGSPLVSSPFEPLPSILSR